MRLFIAIELNDEARAAIDEERQRLWTAMGEASRDLRWVRREHLHLTLAFLGEVDGALADAVISVLTPDLDRAPYEMTLGGLGTFPPRGAPRTLWLGLMGGAEDTIALQALVARRLAAVVPDRLREGQPFKPHLTLARWRERGGQLSMRPPAQSGRALAVVLVERVTLFESRLSTGGPSYTALARARLTCH